MTTRAPELNRREFLRGRFTRFAERLRSAPYLPGDRVHGEPSIFLPIHRPPGAADEATFLRDCTRCDRCIDACPHHAIVRAPERFRRAAGTPMIAAHADPCRMCADRPCAAVCEPNVLSCERPAKMGSAHILAENCLPFCTTCVEQCPVSGAMRVENGKPVIDDDICTGCGVCLHICPAPAKAVLLMPRRPDAA